MTRPLEMKINLNALEHLGMNLYSTVPAVLSEIVANSWDADATQVTVLLDKTNGAISIQDNGAGMTRDEVIDRFLTVGFRRRMSRTRTPLRNRLPMGRKGIGKLSSFSIAQIVTVYTVRNGQKTAFQMDANEIKEQMERNDDSPYKPQELSCWPDDLVDGTRIVLTSIKHKITQLTQKGLRQRIARRFSVIGRQHDFIVTIDGTEIKTSDRGYYEHIEYIWYYGNDNNILRSFTNLADGWAPVNRTLKITERMKSSGLSIVGWIGTVKRPRFLKTEDGDNLNRLAIFMRGKLAQENILDEFAQKEIYVDYVVGEIHCDDLDRDNDDDIATSSRQSLKHDDPRFEKIRDIIHQELRYIASQWSDLRRRAGAKILAQEVPEVAGWLNQLQGDTKKKAERWIGRLNALRSGDVKKGELLKASILAFESYRRKEQLDFLDNIADRSIEPILEIFNDIDDLQLSYYGQIVKLRLGVITTLAEKLSADDKETIIRDHIFDHLWLLDPSWERVKGSEAKERSITNYLKGTTEDLPQNQRRARIDIGYRTAQGRHVIVELKRASVATQVDDLTRQIRKYRDGARKLIAQSSYPKWPLDIICLVGKPPPEWNSDRGREDVDGTLASVDARLVFYDELLENSRNAYRDYLEEHKKIDRLWKIFQGIDDFAIAIDE